MKDLKRLAEASLASQNKWEMWKMLEQVAKLRPKVIVEIGIDGGGFLMTLREAFAPDILVGIDIVKHATHEGFNVIYADSQNIKTVALLKKELKGRQIDFLFIDGDHHYEAVKTDFKFFSPLVRPGGIIGFHDTNVKKNVGVEVSKFMRELDKKLAFKSAEFKVGTINDGTRIIWL
jgi:cephalosporin hydroxylase